ncbi:hypothetical protein XZ45_15315 [Salmonella enterica subsp. enterica]|uniref:hypothetical protein n=1 Tax=Salmonella enterica TaxID=28901 RepID=UPI0009736899|nr:hypothetical protein [Salmonella enterica]EBG8069934.1 hypothetical protein [Salmonella enterica subsp. enterica serovar Elisabethville]EBV1891652.1 hypothetical protein [Salmonella enterica subsp. enterica serovar Coquilhatville]ECE0384375.1 hypothetical protein [Salmonella enterica subsp. enterica serovar Aba]EED8014508.1 hypothetical protein [Salmonella enterica subsp. enterica]APY61126.1 hypothetical protein LFZ14_18695 [Salmonella enterica subsp. enterica serovar Hillingdon str. N1529-
MVQLILAKVLLLGDDSNGYIRYEIFSKEGERADYPEKIVVYREKVLKSNGDKYWAKTDEIISLDHLGFQEGGFQTAITYQMRPGRDISSAVGECKKHYRETS